MDFSVFLGPMFGQVWHYLFAYAPLWLLPLLLWLAHRLYFYYINSLWINNLKWVLLEVRLPREIFKSPQAMEVALEAFHQTSQGNKLVDQWWKGRVRIWFSLEIVSLEGKIHFFIRTPDNYRNLIESRMYSQYPGIEIIEAKEDYAAQIPYGAPGSDWDLYCAELEFTKADAYPIKTYVDYGLDKEQEEETKVDPLTPVLELFGTLGPGEQMWYQLIIQASTDRFKKPGTWFKKQGWDKDAQKTIDDILMRDPKTKSTRKTSPTGFPIVPTLSKGEQEVVAAIERSIAKFGFDTGFRVMYLGKGDKMNNRVHVPGLLSSVKQFGSLNLNGFKPGYKTDFDYFWENPFGWRLAARKRQMFRAYVERSYFYPPYIGKPMTLCTEELATIFHFPGKVAETPSFARIESKRGEPPANLPI